MVVPQPLVLDGESRLQSPTATYLCLGLRSFWDHWVELFFITSVLPLAGT